MAGRSKKVGDICYVDHRTGESDHMNAHIYVRECENNTTTRLEAACDAFSEDEWDDLANATEEEAAHLQTDRLVELIAALREWRRGQQ